jgi:hypothetical protein
MTNTRCPLRWAEAIMRWVSHTSPSVVEPGGKSGVGGVRKDG